MQIELPRAFGELLKPKRYKVFYGGRGGAKSWAFALALLTIGLSRPLRVLCTRELQASIKDSVHQLLSDTISRYPEMAAHYKITDKTIIGKNGTEFGFKGLKHNKTELKSYEGCDIAWVEEAQIVSDASWEILIPTIRKANSEIWISFNPKRPTDPTYERFVFKADEDMLVKKVSYRDNPFFSDVLEKERLKLQKNDPEAYNHVWEGEFDTRFFGGVYSQEIDRALREGRIREGIYDPALNVGTVWDWGYSHNTVAWCYQICGREVRWIDHIEANEQDPQYYAEQLIGHKLVRIPGQTIREDRYIKGEPLEGHKYERRRTYKYKEHFGPHDSSSKLFQAGGRSMVEQLDQLCGFKLRVVHATTQTDSEKALISILKNSWFDKEYTKDGVHCLNSYHYPYDDERGKFKDLPLHDWSADTCDAAEILGQVMKEQKKPQKEKKPRFFNDMTANEVFWGLQQNH